MADNENRSADSDADSVQVGSSDDSETEAEMDDVLAPTTNVPTAKKRVAESEAKEDSTTEPAVKKRKQVLMEQTIKAA